MLELYKFGYDILVMLTVSGVIFSLIFLFKAFRRVIYSLKRENREYNENLTRMIVREEFELQNETLKNRRRR